MKAKISAKDLTILATNIVDHFDKNLFVFLVPIISGVFFVDSSYEINIKYSIYGYLIIAIAGMAKFAGIFYFAKIADLYSPSNALLYSVCGISLMMFCIGALPSYEEIGIISSMLFILIKILSEVFAAGESIIARNYILENKNGPSAISASSNYHISTMAGIILASIAASYIFSYDRDSWRLFFFFAATLGAVIFIYRGKMRQKSINKSTISKYKLSILWAQRAILLKMSIICVFSYITYSLPFIIMVNLQPQISDVTITQMVNSNIILLVLDVAILWFLGKILGSHCFRNIMIAASSLMGVCIIPLWYATIDASIEYINFFRIFCIIIGTTYSICLTPWLKIQCQNISHKYLIIGMSTLLGSFIAGFLPALSLYLFQYFENYMIIGLTVAALSFLATILIKYQDKR